MAIRWRLRRAGEVAALAAAAVPAYAMMVATMAAMTLLVIATGPLLIARYVAAYALHGDGKCGRPGCVVCRFGGPSLEPDPLIP